MLPRAISKFKKTVHEKRAIMANDGNLSIGSLRQDRSHSNVQMLEVSKFKPVPGLSNQAMEDMLKAREEEEMNKELDQNNQEQEQENNEQGQEQEEEQEPRNKTEAEIENHMKYPTESEPESVKEKKRMKLNDVLYHLGIDVSPETDQEETEFRD